VLGYLTSLVVILAGIGFGFATTSVHKITEWIVSVLVPAFVAPNVLKWHWWRFNGHGVFAGMVAGTAAALVIPLLKLHPIFLFLLILAISSIASGVVCLLTAPESEQGLKSFYRTVRPWGFWRPIYERLRAENPHFQANQDFRWDVFNVAVGLVWQTSMVTLPIFLVIQQYGRMWLSLAVFAATSLVLKFTWYDRLAHGAMYMPEDR